MLDCDRKVLPYCRADASTYAHCFVIVNRDLYQTVPCPKHIHFDKKGMPAPPRPSL
jgi:hypothetical protein